MSMIKAILIECDECGDEEMVEIPFGVHDAEYFTAITMEEAGWECDTYDTCPACRRKGLGVGA